MSSDRSVHSNAFNFMSHLAGGVDARTGLYTFSANLRTVSGNDLLGPEFEVVLRYGPLVLSDSGFGAGWYLPITQFDPAQDRRIIALANGETFKADGRVGATNQLTMSEKKIDTFHLYEDSGSQWRVVHRSGVVEILQPKGSGQYARAVATRIFSRQGHWLDLEYDTFGGFPMLTRITDMRGATLLAVKREGNQVNLTLPTDLGDATYTLVLGLNNRVDRIELPTDNRASWRFTYLRQRNVDCISSVRTPAGGFEELTYGDAGHEFPIGSGLQPLPRVTRHVQHPGQGQPAIDTRYTYPANGHNFLGGNARLTWVEDGLDNLFRQVIDYDYSTTETLWVDGKPVRSTLREFNKFHLLTANTTYFGDLLNDAKTEVIGNQINSATTTYKLQPGLFKEQPNYCQLPHGVETRWWLKSNPGNTYTLSEASTYDDHGNLKTHKADNGIEDTYVWYGAAESGFPGHAEGFVSYLKEKVQSPATDQSGSAPVRTEHYTYQQLPVLTLAQSQTQQANWLEVDVETYTSGDVEKVLTRTYKRATDEAGTEAMPLQHGRLLKECAQYPNPLKDEPGAPQTLDTTIEHTYTYETLSWDKAKLSGPLVTGTAQVLQDAQSVTGYDGTIKSIATQHSLAVGEQVLTHDDADIEIMTVWDALLRVEREIVSPGKPEEAVRRYEYTLCATSDEQASQTRYDVKDIMTVAYFDGAFRTVSEYRDTRLLESPLEPGAERDTRLSYQANYDGWGRLVNDTEIDWLTDRSLPLQSQYRYDAWGEQLCVIGPDGVAAFAETDPVGDGKTGPITREWREQVLDADGNELSGGRKTGVTETQLNRFKLPVSIRRWVIDEPDDDDETVLKSETLTSYDGFGRKTEEVSGLGSDVQKQKEAFSYDGFDRLLTHTRREGEVVYRTYAAHSDKDLPVSIAMNALLLGEQRFDGLDRMTSSITGKREQLLEYGPGQIRPNKVITPEGAIEYQYRPHLTEEPVLRTLSGKNAHYEFDEHNARLKYCDEEDGHAFSRTYYTTGEVHTESRGDYEMKYGYSLLGRMETYQDVLKQVQVNEYDAAGRLELTTLGALSSEFKYDSLGRTLSFETIELAANGQAANSLLTELAYDDLEREVSRTFTYKDAPQQVLTQVHDDFDRVVERTLSEQGVTLRKEVYGYDTRGRLADYQCTGDHCPLDPYGHKITRQVFRFDPVDNIRQVLTQFPGGQNMAVYAFDNEGDPAQLTSITNNHGAPYPAKIVLEYDSNGNLIKDDAGRTLQYDALNRLTTVVDPEKGTCEYGYDPKDTLSSTDRSA